MVDVFSTVIRMKLLNVSAPGKSHIGYVELVGINLVVSFFALEAVDARLAVADVVCVWEGELFTLIVSTILFQ